jgi:hypothetical protein
VRPAASQGHGYKEFYVSSTVLHYLRHHPINGAAVRSSPLTISRALALGVAVALAVDAYVHATSSRFYDPAHGGLITEGNLFRAEAVVSGVLVVLLLLRPSGWTLAAALLVATSALAAVVLYRYVDVGSIGPIPDLYEPTWHVPGKLPSAYAEGIAVVLSAAAIALTRARRHRVSTQPRGDGFRRGESSRSKPWHKGCSLVNRGGSSDERVRGEDALTHGDLERPASMCDHGDARQIELSAGEMRCLNGAQRVPVPVFDLGSDEGAADDRRG